MTTTKKWYVIYTKARAEKKINFRLQAIGIETYLPLTKILRQWSDRKKWVEVPLFNSYIFVKISLKEYENVRRVDGVVNFIYHLRKPAVIRDEEIEAIEKFLANTEHKSIEFVPNEKVEIGEGLLMGKKGKILKIGKNKVILLIEDLDTVIKAELAKSMLIKA